MSYAPKGKPQPVVEPGEFIFAASHLDHGHINGQCNGLVEAGGQCKWVYDPQPERVEAFLKMRPEAKAASSLEQILEDPEVKLVASAAIPSERGPLGCRVMEAGKDYFTDKCPFTTLDQLAEARKVAARTGQKYMVYYSERLHVESAVFAQQLIEDGVIGKVLHMEIFGPHRLGKANRPAWFFEKARYGGILTDIASHQFDQFLAYTGAKGGQVTYARVDNYANADKPELEDFGEAILLMDTGASGYSRVDWFTPDGLRSWGDGRSFIVGTEGTIEVRKYLDLANEGSNKVFLVTREKEEVYEVGGKVGYPFFGQLILDVLNRTENAMTQEHAFLASELSLKAQAFADGNRVAG